MEDLKKLTEDIIGAAIQVHCGLGPGLLEATYEAAFCVELDERGIKYRRQLPIAMTYKNRPVGEYRLDLLVEDAVIVEIKSVERIDPVFSAQVLTYLRASGKRIGLLINFNGELLRTGIRRFIL